MFVRKATAIMLFLGIAFAGISPAFGFHLHEDHDLGETYHSHEIQKQDNHKHDTGNNLTGKNQAGMADETLLQRLMGQTLTDSSKSSIPEKKYAASDLPHSGLVGSKYTFRGHPQISYWHKNKPPTGIPFHISKSISSRASPF